MSQRLKHMDIASRNQRLRETLEGMGLFVLPIYSESDPLRIDYMHVSACLPERVQEGCQQAASATVAHPMSSPQVEDRIGTADGARPNVVDFPAVGRS